MTPPNDLARIAAIGFGDASHSRSFSIRSRSPRSGVLLLLLCSTAPATAQIADFDPARFANAIKRFEKQDARNDPARGGTVIVGSSSVRRLDAATVFPNVDLIQRGFGGAHISDINYYAEQLVFKHEPSTVVFFCGGNDLWVGHSVDQVEEDFREFAALLFERLPRCRLVALAVRPSPKRRQLLDSVLELNARLERFAATDERVIFLRGSCDRFLDADGEPIASMYVDDMQHMNDDGYAVWAEILAPHLAPYRRNQTAVSDADPHE